MPTHSAVIHAGSAGFLLALAALAASGAFRSRFLAVFRLPTPANQAVIEPFDSIRGLSALWVALYHSWQWLRPFNEPGTRFLIENGHLAVPVFVAISAFLIYRTLKPISTADQLLGYFKRRWLRIYPLYFVTTAVILAFGYAGAARVGAWRIGAEFLMARLWGYHGFYNPPAWSLYVEEGFYLVVPLWFLAWRRRAALGAAVTYAALSALAAARPGRELDLMRYFCVGIFLTETIDSTGGIREGFKWAVLALGLGLGFVTVASYTEGWPYYYFSLPEELTDHLFPIAVFCVLWASVNVRQVSRVLSLYPLRFLGIISYSMYLWHSILIAIGTPIVFTGDGGIEPANLLSSAVRLPRHGPAAFYFLYGSAWIFYAALSYAAIEYPFLLLRRRTFRRAEER